MSEATFRRPASYVSPRKGLRGLPLLPPIHCALLAVSTSAVSPPQGVAEVTSLEAGNPGEYELKVLWNNKLARSLKFTVAPGGKFDNGVASANRLGSDRVIVPVAVLGEQDGQWDRAAWKTEGLLREPPERVRPLTPGGDGGGADAAL